MLSVWRPANHALAECPIWDDKTGTLWWVDIFAGTLHNSRNDRSYGLPGPVGSIGLQSSGNLVAATAGGVVSLEPVSGSLSVLNALDDELAGGKRTNDGKVGPDGAFWFGTMIDGSETPAGALYRTVANGKTEKRLGNLFVPNGLAWASDNRHFFHVDTGTSEIRRFPFRDGELGVPDRVIDLSQYPGSPDGMTIDSDGNLWVCFWGGATVRQITPYGEVLLEVPLPVSNPTSCTFGGGQFSKLFITTAAFGLTYSARKSEPLAGSIFVLETASTGVPTNLFG